ncbi:MAG: hypothetical protein ACJ8FT_11995 [Sphingomonas sp.]
MMRITITKGDRGDSIEAIRADGSRVSTLFPHKGPVPHDAVHFFVESELGIASGFWGQVASGRHPEEVQEIAKAGGHASAKRASVPDAAIVPMLQAERAVECFEADLWSGGEGDPDSLRSVIGAGCAHSLVPPVEVSDRAIERIRSGLADLRSRWSSLPKGDSLSFEWVEAAA